MKKKLFLVAAVCGLLFASCGGDDTNYAETFIGDYEVTITPSLKATVLGEEMNVPMGAQSDTWNIALDGDDGDVKVTMMTSKTTAHGYADKDGLHLDNTTMSGTIAELAGYTNISYTVTFQHPTIAAPTQGSSATIMSWSATTTGTGSATVLGRNISVPVNGYTAFLATKK